jgi:hypothetical protein
MPRARHEGIKVLPAIPCELHKRHEPSHDTTELHHLVPVAWQQLWQPPKPWPFPGTDPDGRGPLWDARTVKACPTGHRNIHAWIVRLMKVCRTEGAQETVTAALNLYRPMPGGVEFDQATLALVHWKEGGGSLQQLVAAGEWGES